MTNAMVKHEGLITLILFGQPSLASTLKHGGDRYGLRCRREKQNFKGLLYQYRFLDLLDRALRMARALNYTDVEVMEAICKVNKGKSYFSLKIINI